MKKSTLHKVGQWLLWFTVASEITRWIIGLYVMLIMTIAGVADSPKVVVQKISRFFKNLGRKCKFMIKQRSYGRH